MGKQVFVNCDEANHLCDKSQYKESSGLEKLKLLVHVIYCRACRKYSLSNHKLTNLIKKSDLETLDEAEKNELKLLFEKEFSKLK